jgi:hypothetical protein
MMNVRFPKMECMSMKIDERQVMDSDAYSQTRSGFRFGRQIIF